MQEKVHLTPPEIKIFEGKPPSQSWVDQNIVRYFQIRSEHEFLTDVKNYAQELQSRHLSKSRRIAIPLKEVFVEVPEDGSSHQVSNAILFNLSQSNLKIELEYLEKLIRSLQKGAPALAAELEDFVADLKQAGNSFPKLSEQQLELLPKILDKLTEYAKRSSIKTQKNFWKLSSNMLEEMMNSNKEALEDVTSESKELQARNKMLFEVENMLNTILSSLQAKPPTAEQFHGLIANLQNLGNHFSKLDEQQQQALVNFFGQLEQLKCGKNNLLVHKLADAVVQTKIQEFVKNNPKANTQQLLEFLRKFLDGSQLLNSNLPLMRRMGQSIEELLSRSQFPDSEGFSGVKFASVEDKKIVPHEAFANAILEDYSTDEQSFASLKDTKARLAEMVQQEAKTTRTKIAGYDDAKAAIGEQQANYGKAAVGATAGASSSGSLPDDFQKAILNHYMPGQEAYLRELAMLLFIDNMGAEAGNALLNAVTDFGEAADNYDFSNWLHSSNGDFSGSVSKAKAQLSREKNQVSTDLNKANNAVNTAASEIKKIDAELKNKNLTASQRQTLINQRNSLKNFIYNLEVAIRQLVNLRSILNSIHIHGPKGKGHTSSKYFSITGPKGWQTTLSNDEDYVINGDPKNAKKHPPEPVGGLVNIQSDIQAFQQKYSDQSQNQQMILQMRMTEIQQEWTVVSTALQLLNQMYMSVAQAIYK